MSVINNQSICHCINLRRAAAAISDYYDQLLKPAGLTVNQYSLLINIHRNQPLNVSALAELVGLERTTLARTLKPLFRDGLIGDRAWPGSRERQLHLSGAGLARLKKASALWERAQENTETALGPGGVKNLTHLLFQLEKLKLSK